ncbi:hypothetical protein [Propionispira arboris]|uniref:hypothetical protein n=1 Tax=Propionispira arboris TaxID=84035 RepID=UPI0015A58EED|nr:hypothetical protein [Propionispira arboris]
MEEIGFIYPFIRKSGQDSIIDTTSSGIVLEGSASKSISYVLTDDGPYNTTVS